MYTIYYFVLCKGRKVFKNNCAIIIYYIISNQANVSRRITEVFRTQPKQEQFKPDVCFGLLSQEAVNSNTKHVLFLPRTILT